MNLGNIDQECRRTSYRTDRALPADTRTRPGPTHGLRTPSTDRGRTPESATRSALPAEGTDLHTPVPEIHGDAALAPLLQSGRLAAAIHWLPPPPFHAGEVSVASLGASARLPTIEIGSVSKGITGLLYADALTRGELGPDTTLGELLPLGDCPAAGLTLASLSAGTPPGCRGLPRSGRTLAAHAAFLLHGTNPYGETLEELLAQARTVQLSAGTAPRPRYSNFGFELLGHAVAAGAGMSFRAWSANGSRLRWA